MDLNYSSERGEDLLIDIRRYELGMSAMLIICVAESAAA